MVTNILSPVPLYRLLTILLVNLTLQRERYRFHRSFAHHQLQSKLGEHQEFNLLMLTLSGQRKHQTTSTRPSSVAYKLIHAHSHPITHILTTSIYLYYDWTLSHSSMPLLNLIVDLYPQDRNQTIVEIFPIFLMQTIRWYASAQYKSSIIRAFDGRTQER